MNMLKKLTPFRSSMHQYQAWKLLAVSVVLCSSLSMYAEEWKPRLVVLTDIAPNDIEPDDMESLIRLLAHADLFEIEALVATTGWSNTGGLERLDLIMDALDAYEKDLPNLMKRSAQTDHLSDESRQLIGYWPSPAYLRSRSMIGSETMGQHFIGEGNDSAGSDFIIQLADESDDRPLWITVWGGGNTIAQAIWRVKAERSQDELKRFLDNIRVYTITDQDRPWGNPPNPYEISSHQWMRKQFEKDLLFIWDESAWLFQNETGKANWEAYAEHIQGHGALGALYPKYKWGVEGDTPSFLHVWPNGLNDPDEPGHGGWGGYFEHAVSADGITRAYTNHDKTAAHSISRKYENYFYPAIFNSFVARMHWAKHGTGNRNPRVVIDSDASLQILRFQPSVGSTLTMDASASHDPDGDALSFHWWMLQEAGTYPGELTLSGERSHTVQIQIPKDAVGTQIHLICEVTDDGDPSLTSYRRIILEPSEAGGK